jgi:hypothetical protein
MFEQAADIEVQRMSEIVNDLRWYADRIGKERLDIMPRSNKWSFQQNLWRHTKQVKKAIAPVSNRVLYFIDCGKECVGLASEIFALFEYSSSD